MRLGRIILLIFLVVAFNAVKGQGIPFRKTDKGPLGTYALYDQMPQLFPNATFSITYNPPSNKLKTSYTQGDGYFVIAPYTDFTKEDITALKNFVDKGNVLVISSYFLDDKIEEWLEVKLSRLSFGQEESDSINVINFANGEYESFFLGKAYNSYIATYDTTAPDLQILGKYKNGKINSITFKKGGGYIVLHTQPHMFTNYHILKKKTYAYSELFFSALPGPLATIYWDESSKTSDGGNMAPLSFIMSQKPLRNAFWWALAGLILLVLFSLKRKQRVIPVLSPLVNNSMDMVRTVSDMYYFSRRNEVIAKKKIAHWLEYLRNKHNITTNQSPAIFWQSFKMRSGMAEADVAELRLMVDKYRNGDVVVSDINLIRLNNLIDSSYKF